MEDDEKEALKAVYCLPGECCFQGNSVTITLAVDIPTSDSPDSITTTVPVKVFFSVRNDYPATLPDISIFSEHLNRDNIANIKAQVAENFGDFTGEPMILAISSIILEAARLELEPVIRDAELSKPATGFEGGIDDGEGYSAVLHIDHMRSKNRYCKTLERWAEEFGLTGRIVFLHRLILVLLQGSQDSVKDFIIHLKTVNVDVDSKGHSCKERMMKVLVEGKTKSSLRLPSFQRCELTADSELQGLFSESGLDDQWDNVHSLVKRFH